MEIERTVEGEVSLAEAARALRELVGHYLPGAYLPGKTVLRDVLYDRFGLSQLEAEDLCDSIERAGLVTFVQAETEEESGWTILPDELAGGR